jgi:hypothetical protein
VPQKTEYVAARGIIVITYTGRVTMDEVKDATVQAIGIQKQGLTDLVLIDASAMTAWPTLTEMFVLVQSYPDLQVPPQTRLAAVRSQAPDSSDLAGFYETVCRNRCYDAKAFHTREDAERWLRSDRT